jgi:ubiquinone/menaquinone biosynthesis C-methylase UbiE
MNKHVNAQYNLAAPESLPVRVAARVRRCMFEAFMAEFEPSGSDTVLDIGATSDQTYIHSNYFEAYYPFKNQITAAGIDDASFLQTLYPGVRFVFANALHLPFSTGAFDLVHSSAVLEHVGSSENQFRMIFECLRVARRGIFLTTPNRWFPIEFHTQLPLFHWLPTPVYRAIYQAMGYGFFAKEGNLNLMTRAHLQRATTRFSGWQFRVESARLLGLKSNLILIAHRWPQR